MYKEFPQGTINYNMYKLDLQLLLLVSINMYNWSSRMFPQVQWLDQLGSTVSTVRKVIGVQQYFDSIEVDQGRNGGCILKRQF